MEGPHDRFHIREGFVSVFGRKPRHDIEQSPQKITGARWRDPETIHDWIDAVPKDQDVVVYCVKGGSVSQSVTAQLKGQACRVKYLDGGIKAWQESGRAVV